MSVTAPTRQQSPTHEERQGRPRIVRLSLIALVAVSLVNPAGATIRSKSAELLRLLPSPEQGYILDTSVEPMSFPPLKERYYNQYLVSKDQTKSLTVAAQIAKDPSLYDFSGPDRVHGVPATVVEGQFNVKDDEGPPYVSVQWIEGSEVFEITAFGFDKTQSLALAQRVTPQKGSKPFSFPASIEGMTTQDQGFLEDALGKLSNTEFSQGPKKRNVRVCECPTNELGGLRARFPWGKDIKVRGKGGFAYVYNNELSISWPESNSTNVTVSGKDSTNEAMLTFAESLRTATDEAWVKALGAAPRIGQGDSAYSHRLFRRLH
jgi:hypothetical protein